MALETTGELATSGDLTSTAGLITYVVPALGTVLFVVIVFAFLIRLYRRASKETAFVRTGMGGEKVVMNGGALVFPVLHETMPVNMNTLVLPVVRRDTEALITLDRLRIDVKAEFYVRVRPDATAIAMAAQTLGQRTMHTGLDQTSIEHFNANNAFDAEGLTKLTEQIEQRKKLRNDIEQDTRVQIETKNLEASKRSFEISRDQEYARLEQEREVEVRRAGQAAEIAREQAERTREADAARIEAKKQVDAQQIEADRLVEEARIIQQRALEIARQEQQIAVQNKSREESQAKAEADDARAKAVEAEERVTTARESELAARQKQIELIEGVKVQAEAEKDAATNRAEALKMEAQGQAEAEKLRAEAARVRFEVEAAGQRAINEAANILTMEQVSLQTKLALLKVLPEIIRESAKPMEAIDSIKIVQVDGLTHGGRAANDGTGSGGGAGGGSGNLASDAVAAALAYRAQAPVLDGLMKELGLDGSSLSGLVKSAAEAESAPPAPAKAAAPKAIARDNDADDGPTGEAAE